MRHLLLRIFKILLILCIGGFLWSSWYLYTKGFSRSWRNRLAYEFRHHGVELSVRRLNLDPFRGLIAKDVRIYDGPGSSDILAEVSHIGLDINYGNLFRGEDFLNSIDLRDTSLSLRIDRKNKKAPKLEITKLKARILFPPQQIRVTQAQFEISGITCHVSGTLLVPEDYRMELPKNNDNDTIPVLHRLLEELAQTEFEPNKAQIELNFSGDVSHLQDILIEEAVFNFGKIKRPLFSLEGVQAKMNYRDRVLNLQSLQVRDARGVLNVGGFFNTAVGEGKLQLQSTLQFQPIIAELMDPNILGELTFYSQPEVDAFIAIDTKAEKKMRVIGEILVEKFAIRSVMFQNFHADFSWDGEQTLIRNIELFQQEGRLTGQVLQSPNDFRIMLSSTVNPAALAPLFGGNIIRFLNLWEFTESPRIEFHGQGPGWDIDKFAGSGRIEFGKTIFRGQGVQSAYTDLEIADGKTIYRDFYVQRSEGAASGTIIFDFRNQYVSFDNVHAEVIPVEAAVWISPRLVRDVTPYRFNAPPKLQINGRVKVQPRPLPPAASLPAVRRAQPVTAIPRPPIEINLEVKAVAAEGMDYTFIDKNLPFKKVSGTLLFENSILKLHNISGMLFNGKLNMTGNVSLDRANQKFSSTITASDMDFESLTRLYFGYEDSKGRLSGHYKFTSKGKEAQTMQGEGSVEVIDGDVFAIPFLGPISTILNSIVPGMGVSKARDGKATFTISNGVIHTDDMVVAGQGFSLIGNGDLFFLKDQMDFDIRINARGIPGVLLFPVSKLFEYTSQESLRHPQWRPKLLTP